MNLGVPKTAEFGQKACFLNNDHQNSALMRNHKMIHAQTGKILFIAFFPFKNSWWTPIPHQGEKWQQTSQLGQFPSSNLVQ